MAHHRGGRVDQLLPSAAPRPRDTSNASHARARDGGFYPSALHHCAIARKDRTFGFSFRLHRRFARRLNSLTTGHTFASDATPGPCLTVSVSRCETCPHCSTSFGSVSQRDGRVGGCSAAYTRRPGLILHSRHSVDHSIPTSRTPPASPQLRWRLADVLCGSAGKQSRLNCTRTRTRLRVVRRLSATPAR